MNSTEKAWQSTVGAAWSAAMFHPSVGVVRVLNRSTLITDQVIYAAEAQSVLSHRCMAACQQQHAVYFKITIQSKVLQRRHTSMLQASCNSNLSVRSQSNRQQLLSSAFVPVRRQPQLAGPPCCGAPLADVPLVAPACLPPGACKVTTNQIC